MGKSKLESWTFLEHTEVLRTRIYGLFSQRWRSPRTGVEHDFSVIDSADWVNVVALDEHEQVILVRQFRFGTGAFSLEVPGGMVDAGERPEATAVRELREETGYRAGSVTSLGWIEPNPALINNRTHIYLAEGCVREGELKQDAGEDIEVVVTPLPEALRLLRAGEITHALAAVALHRYELHRAGELRVQPA